MFVASRSFAIRHSIISGRLGNTSRLSLKTLIIDCKKRSCAFSFAVPAADWDPCVSVMAYFTILYGNMFSVPQIAIQNTLNFIDCRLASDKETDSIYS